MVKVITEYDDSKKAVIIIGPTEIKVAKRDYEAIQTATEGYFGNLYIRGRLKINPTGKITYLNLSDLKVEIRDLHPGLADLTSLKTLNLDGNSLIELPEVIGRLTSLRKLQLERNTLTELPGCLGNLKRLEELDLSYNQLTSLPEWIEKLSSLKEFYANFNKIETLPESMRKMSSLEYFVIRSNSLNAKAKTLIGELKKVV